MNLLLYNFFMHIIKFLLTEREVCVYREISDPGLLCTDRARRTRFVQKDRDPIFLCAFRASEVNKKFIIWHLLAFVLEKNKQERHDLKCILVAWYTFGRRKQKISM
jgi:hypothetical protein